MVASNVPHMTTETQMEYQPHRLASYYPKLGKEEYKALRASVKAHGLLNDITLFEGAILDGTNRYRACIDEGVEPRFKQLPKGIDPVDFVIASNETRRHLTREQLVVIGARLAKVTRGGDRKSQPLENTVAKVAEKLKVSKSSIKRAQNVLKKGTPEIVAALENSELTVHEASEISTLPKETQPTVLGAIREDRKQEKADRAALKAAKKAGVVPVPTKKVSDVDKRWNTFAPQFKALLKLFKGFNATEQNEVRRRINECLTGTLG
jgi:ParB-like chromosome segregation protein Spo0J